MSKYKLIREYPGSPKIGTECNQLESDTITAYPEFWEKIEEKVSLFRTEDGVDVFEGDEVWFVNPVNDYKSESKCMSRGDILTNHLKWFSTKESAQTYIDENKPEYSEKDMIEFAKQYKRFYGLVIGMITEKEFINDWVDKRDESTCQIRISLN